MSSKLVKIALAIGGLFLVLALAGAILLYVGLNRWLAGEDCRRLVTGLVGNELQIDGTFQPFQWSGFSVYSEGFEGKGRAGGSVRNIRAEQVRAELNFPALLRGTWEISEISVARLRADLGETAPPETPSAPAPPGASPGLSLPFLPKDFVLRQVRVQEADVFWPGEGGKQGYLAKTQIDVASDGADWKFAGKGGKFFQPGLPELKVDSYSARFKPPQNLYVDFNLRDAAEGTLAGRGQIDFAPGGRMELQVDLNRVDLNPFLEEDWRAKFTGKVNGPVELKSELGEKDGMKARGSLKLTDAKVEALPVLDTVALLTRTQEFRSMKLQTAQADFEWEQDRMAVKNIVLESELLLKITGNYLQVGKTVDGLLQVGTTPEVLSAIPGAKARVFTEAKEGYVWTPVRLSGTTTALNEDLTPRLRDAALGTVIDLIPTDAPEKINKGVDKVLDFLNKNSLPLP